MESLEKKPKGKTIKNSALLILCAALIIFIFRLWFGENSQMCRLSMKCTTLRMSSRIGLDTEKLAYESGTIEYCTSADTWSRF